MKVVLFCGGMGTRIRDHAPNSPKPMVTIGHRPILWHVMKYYAHFGHREFILCLGYRGDVIRRSFLPDAANPPEPGDPLPGLLAPDLAQWRLTGVDTGLEASVGQRLRAVESHLGGDDIFLANYSDGLADVPLPEVIDRFMNSGRIGLFVSVRPQATFHLIQADPSGRVTSIEHVRNGGARINGGFFVFRREIFRFIQPGEDLVDEPFQRLIKEGELITFSHPGFWACMDTFREKQQLEDIYVSGKAPWMVWAPGADGESHPASRENSRAS